jgi:general secretion pathway protein B
MSILLDALKRSESQRELGTVPTLQTSIESSTGAVRQVPGWLPTLMSLATAVMIGWMGLAQFSLPEDWAETHLKATAGKASPEGTESRAANSATDQPALAGKSILPQLPESAAANPQEAAAAEDEVVQRSLGREVRDYTAQEPAASASVGPAESTAEPRRENALRQPELARVELAREEPVLTAGEQPARSDTLQSQQPYEPEIISYWQVPEKMREGLPDLRISVLVYAELPENRFVLMNGERVREGQELPNGLLLEEIRRDRAIFNYRNYRFYLKS